LADSRRSQSYLGGYWQVLRPDLAELAPQAADRAGPIIGARTLEQLEDNIGASGWELMEEQVEELSEASTIEDVYPYCFIRNAQRV
jgi:hypothetical protein